MSRLSKGKSMHASLGCVPVGFGLVFLLGDYKGAEGRVGSQAPWWRGWLGNWRETEHVCHRLWGFDEAWTKLSQSWMNLDEAWALGKQASFERVAIRWAPQWQAVAPVTVSTPL